MAEPAKDPHRRRLIEELRETIFLFHLREQAGIDLTERTSTGDGLSGITGCDDGSLDSFISDTIGKSAGITNQYDMIVQWIVVLQIDITSTKLCLCDMLLGKNLSE